MHRVEAVMAYGMAFKIDRGGPSLALGEPPTGPATFSVWRNCDPRRVRRCGHIRLRTAKIELAAPVKVTDLPEDAPRFTQGAQGIHNTIVNDGAHTGDYPGKVLRS